MTLKTQTFYGILELGRWTGFAKEWRKEIITKIYCIEIFHENKLIIDKKSKK